MSERGTDLRLKLEEEEEEVKEQSRHPSGLDLIDLGFMLQHCIFCSVKCHHVRTAESSLISAQIHRLPVLSSVGL